MDREKIAKEILDIEKKWNNFKFHHPLDYEKREYLKDMARALISRYRQLENYRACAFYLLHGIITSHYWRAREHIENSKTPKKLLKYIRGKKYYANYELDIDHYTCHWLWANGEREELFPKESIELIKKEWYYKSEKNKYLPKGMSIYQGF